MVECFAGGEGASFTRLLILRVNSQMTTTLVPNMEQEKTEYLILMLENNYPQDWVPLTKKLSDIYKVHGESGYMIPAVLETARFVDRWFWESLKNQDRFNMIGLAADKPQIIAAAAASIAYGWKQEFQIGNFVD